CALWLNINPFMSKQRLLMITPAVPRATGGGLAMRAFYILRALATQYDVSLLVPDFGYCRQPSGADLRLPAHKIAHYDLGPYKDLSALFQSVCYRTFPQFYFNLLAKPSDWRFINGSRISKVCAPYLNDRFDVVHIHRLYMTPFAQPFLRNKF